ncbi:MAG: polymer-forming cytoskeletal protein [Flavobacteriales bacterium]|nr:polymer-forming cytoskeletal protein [Flavobacteriales bacterium]
MARNFDQAPDMAINRIVEGTNMQGEITSESNIRIDGIFTGTINTKGRLVIGPQGLVDGTVICENSEIEGKLKGKISVKQLLTLKATAKVEGDMITDKLSIEPGATFTGTCSMGSKVKDMKSFEKEGNKEAQLEEQTA